MAFTDPPYNVSLGDHGGKPARPRRAGASRTTPWRRKPGRPSAGAGPTTSLANVDGALYICMSTKEWPTVSRVLAEAGGHWSDTIIWEKDRFVLGRSDYQRAYEPIWYGWREGAKRHFSGGRDQSDVWKIERPSDSPLHPTMKPLPLDRAGHRELHRSRETWSWTSSWAPDPPSSPPSAPAGSATAWSSTHTIVPW